MYWTRPKKLIKLVSCVSAFMLVFSSFMTSAFFNTAVPQAAAAPGDDLCQVPVDVVLLMDVSESMEEGEAPSQCEWLQYEPPNPKCVHYTEENVTEEWCGNQESPPPCKGYTYTPSTQSKIDSAKDAANSFLDNMGPNDQSGLVSFANNASLDKELNDNHAATKAAVDILPTGGATNIGDAIDFATQQFNSNGNGQAVKAMILLTDGKANKPDNVDDPKQYAIEKAAEAAGIDYRIFTIGLGSNSNINQDMLLEIADVTGAQYYHAPNGDGLSAIYDDIAWEICQYGSIEVCKLKDYDNSLDTFNDRESVADWNVVLSGGVNSDREEQTDEEGCFIFSNLLEGTYTLSEGDNSDKGLYIPIFPPDDNEFEDINLEKGDNLKGYVFINYFPVCGNGIADDYSDQSYQEECDNGENNGDNVECSSTCTLNPQCNDGQDNDQDGLIDLEDPDCENPEDNDETGEPAPTYECSDGIDNDQDGLIDYPDDLGCENSEDNNETDEVPPVVIQPGDIVINEIIQNPHAGGTVSDAKGEWFELYNTTQNSIDLIGCSITDNGDDNHIINDSLVLPAGGYAVLGRNGDPAQNGGYTPNYVYSGFRLKNAADEVILICDNTEIDRVEYDGGPNFPYSAGASMIYDINLLNSNPSVNNDIGTNWCESTLVWDGSAGDFGSPGEPNESCNGCIPQEDSYVCVSDGRADITYIYDDPETCGQSFVQEGDKSECDCVYSEWEDDECVDEQMRQTRTANFDYCLDLEQFVDDPSCISGPSVIINEVAWMGSPPDRGSDEWIELKNTTGTLIDLTGWTLQIIGDDPISLENSIEEYYLLERTDDDSVPDVLADQIYSGALKDGGEFLELRDSVGALVDSVDGSEGWQAGNKTTKQTMQLCLDEWQDSLEPGGTPRAQNICEGEEPEEPGSLVVYKYEDLDGDLETTEDQSLATTTNWVFSLEYDQSILTATTTAGTVTFSDLEPGEYDVEEQVLENWYLVGTDPDNQSVLVESGQQAEINFYNTQYSTIYGYKYEDLDGLASTTADIVGLENWTVNLFDLSTSTPISTTTTDSSGYFEFNNLVPGDYLVTEEDREYWFPIGATSTEFSIELGGTASSTSFINYYDGPDGYIFGCKFNDENNNRVIDEQEGKLGGWSIILEKQVCESECNWIQVTSLITESDQESPNFGCYRFNYLTDGHYRVTEEAQTGWNQNYPHDPDYYEFDLLESSPTTTIDFLNYYQGYCGDEIKNNNEECDGSDGVPDGWRCTEQCVLKKVEAAAATGGGGFTQNPQVELSVEYELQKHAGLSYIESLVVSNSGNIVLTNGTIKIDLPVDKLEFDEASPSWQIYYSANEIAEWQIPALGMGDEFTIHFTVKTLNLGTAVTAVDVTFDQTSDSLEFSEEIIQLGIGGPPPIGQVSPLAGPPGQVAGEETGPPAEEAGPPVGVITPVVTGPPAGEEVVVSEQEGEPEVKGEVVVAEAGEGIVKTCTECNWLEWLLIILLFVLLNLAYTFVLPKAKKEIADDKAKKEKESTSNEGQENNFQIWPWVAVAVVLAVIFYVVAGVCKCMPGWIPLVLLLDYLVLLVINSFGRKLSWLFAIFLTVLPIIVLLVSSSWTWWAWVLVIIFYAASLAIYSVRAVITKYWLVNIPMTCLLLILIVIMQALGLS